MLQCRWCVTEEKQLVIRFSILRSQCSAKQPQAGNVSSLNEKRSSTAGTPISRSHCTKIQATLEGPSRPQNPSYPPAPCRFFCVLLYFDYRMQSDGVGGGESADGLGGLLDVLFRLNLSSPTNTHKPNFKAFASSSGKVRGVLNRHRRKGEYRDPDPKVMGGAGRMTRSREGRWE